MRYILILAAAVVLSIGLIDRTFTIPVTQAPIGEPNGDIPKQPQLPNPPEVIKAIYLTSYSAGSEKKINQILELVKDTEINAIVIDIKDYTGNISYRTGNAEIQKYGTEEKRIEKPNALLKRLHDAGLYAIARIAVFQDQALPKTRPDLAVQSKSTHGVWKDQKGITWLDPSSIEVWNYNIAIAEDALKRGFDEINFDYVRFPSDGNLEDVQYPFSGNKPKRSTVMKNFFDYIHEHLGSARTSVDIFGLVTISKDDLGIGQYLEDILPNFTAVAPMVYPSHYAAGFQGYQNPALHPYEVIKYSMDGALARLKSLRVAVAEAHMSTSTATSTITLQKIDLVSLNATRFRPWIQDFDLGAIYTTEMVHAQMQAVEDSLGEESGGWMIWNPANNYKRATLIQ